MPLNNTKDAHSDDTLNEAFPKGSGERLHTPNIKLSPHALTLPQVWCLMGFTRATCSASQQLGIKPATSLLDVTLSSLNRGSLCVCRHLEIGVATLWRCKDKNCVCSCFSACFLLTGQPRHFWRMFSPSTFILSRRMWPSRLKGGL